ncbi:uncharacterized protein V2V93DRAFT_376817 [Kockiozyma suomiensis]|uniref:uncharacterized protein n=1 Tax=Kockiozyma suomiensis TaxID=1337062 RepID=UPI003343CFE3
MPSINTSAVAGNLSSASHDSSTTAATSAATTNRGARITASVDEIIARISAKHKVYGFIIIDPIHHKIIKNDLISSDDRALFVKRKSSNNDTTGINEEQGDEDNNTVSIEEYAEMCINFVKAAEKFTEHFFEQDDDLRFLRLRTKHRELMIVPTPQYILAIIHAIESDQ